MPPYLFIGEGNGKEKGQRGKIAEYMERAFRKQAGLLVEGGKGWEFRAFASGGGGYFCFSDRVFFLTHFSRFGVFLYVAHLPIFRDGACIEGRGGKQKG